MKKIMIVDDEEQIRSVYRGILENAGYQVVEADSGQKCLDMLKGGEKPDLVLLDVMMPKLNGWETGKRIKEDEDLKDILVGMLTIKSQDPDKIKSLGYSLADWHISKPIDKAKFLKTIKWILR